jgi:hypothetical protein
MENTRTLPLLASLYSVTDRQYGSIRGQGHSVTRFITCVTDNGISDATPHVVRLAVLPHGHPALQVLIVWGSNGKRVPIHGLIHGKPSQVTIQETSRREYLTELVPNGRRVVVIQSIHSNLTRITPMDTGSPYSYGLPIRTRSQSKSRQSVPIFGTVDTKNGFTHHLPFILACQQAIDLRASSYPESPPPGRFRHATSSRLHH